MSYLRHLCLFAHSGVQHILCCVFVLFVFVLSLVHPMLPVSMECLFLFASSVLWNVQHGSKNVKKYNSKTQKTKNIILVA
jgi:hypothetical protein